MKSNATIRQEALATMRGKYLAGIVIMIVYGILGSLIGSFSAFSPDEAVGFSLITLLAAIFLGLPLQLGFIMIWLNTARNNTHPELKELFGAFNRRRYTGAVGTLLLVEIFTALWTLLLIVPGIIKSMSYAMTPFLIAEEPELGCNEAIEKSMRLMKGHRWQLFKMYLGMIGWMLLGMLTFCIAWLWIIPYYQTVFAKFYLALKEEQE